MYLDYYNLREKPFQISTDPRFLFFGEHHKEALAVLKYGILDNRGFLLLTGQVGTGKTTLINSLIEGLDENIIVATVPDPGLELLDFYNYIAFAFGINKQYERKTAFLIDFTDFLNKTFNSGKKTLLIIDEAQRLNDNLLEEIRLLSNIEKKTTKLLNIFFVGQEEFLKTVQREQNRALRQRITINYHLEPLSAVETDAYIRHRLKVSGAKREIFSRGAVEAVYGFSKGHPRLINIICDHALLTGYVNDNKSIHREAIIECAQELQIKDENPSEPTLRKPPEAHHPQPFDNDEEVENAYESDVGFEETKRDGLGFFWKSIPFILLAAFLVGVVGLIAYGDSNHNPFEQVDNVWRRIFNKPEPADFKPRMQPDTENTTIARHRIETEISGPQPTTKEHFVEERQTPLPEMSTVEQSSSIPLQDGQESGETYEQSPSIPLQDGQESGETYEQSSSIPLQDGQESGETYNPPVDEQLPKEYTVLFKYNSHDIGPDAFGELDKIADLLKSRADLRVTLKGYTDSIGNPDYNKYLSGLRAEAVKRYLMERGVGVERIETNSMGVQAPGENNIRRTKHSGKDKRRVDIQIEDFSGSLPKSP